MADTGKRSQTCFFISMRSVCYVGRRRLGQAGTFWPPLSAKCVLVSVSVGTVLYVVVTILQCTVPRTALQVCCGVVVVHANRDSRYALDLLRLRIFLGRAAAAAAAAASSASQRFC